VFEEENMINVQLILDNRVVREFNFSPRTPFITIGRRQTHDIHLDNLAVSGNHARLVIDNNHVTLMDMESSNGTLLNGMRIDRPTALNPDDTIQIAKFRLRVSDKREGVHNSNHKDQTTVKIPTAQEKMAKTSIFSYDEIHENDKENAR
jgi:pSer/pThr/pTyr-binding forkhead associated (FHA) protein